MNYKQYNGGVARIPVIVGIVVIVTITSYFYLTRNALKPIPKVPDQVIDESRLPKVQRGAGITVVPHSNTPVTSATGTTETTVTSKQATSTKQKPAH